MDPQRQITLRKVAIKRYRGKIIDAAKKLAVKLNEEIEKGNDTVAFMTALFIAAAKDSIDWILSLAAVGLIPGVGFTISVFVSAFLFFFMLGKGWFLSLRLKFWYWVLGLFVEGLPVFNLLPINSLLVLYAWRLTKKRAEESSIKLNHLNQMTRRQIRRLNQSIDVIEQES